MLFRSVNYLCMFGVWGCGWWVGGLYVHTLVKNLLIKFLMMLFLVAKGCKFDSCNMEIMRVVFTPLLLALHSLRKLGRNRPDDAVLTEEPHLS